MYTARFPNGETVCNLTLEELHALERAAGLSRIKLEVAIQPACGL
jgi:hypothetical protein